MHEYQINKIFTTTIIILSHNACMNGKIAIAKLLMVASIQEPF